MCEDKYKCSVENFIKDKYSICREERQYAVFLYVILRKYNDPEMDERKNDGDVSKIFAACSIPENAKIEHVFYEPTFMRDFFERNRRNVLGEDLDRILLQKTFSPPNYDYQVKENKKDNSFNYKLIKYVCKKIYEEKYGKKIDILDMKPEEYNLEEYNLGGWISKNFKDTEEKIICRMIGMIDTEFQKKAVIQDRIRQMMNVKPDIAVIYSKEKENEKIRELLFLECKFESGESSYKGSGGGKGGETVTQRTIQWLVADFLCGYLKEKGESIEVAEAMKKEKSCLVKFVREKEKNKMPEREEIEKTEENKPQPIEIEKLITLSEKIFP